MDNEYKETFLDSFQKFLTIMEWAALQGEVTWTETMIEEWKEFVHLLRK
jgi:hypothetical protein